MIQSSGLNKKSLHLISHGSQPSHFNLLNSRYIPYEDGYTKHVIDWYADNTQRYSVTNLPLLPFGIRNQERHPITVRKLQQGVPVVQKKSIAHLKERNNDKALSRANVHQVTSQVELLYYYHQRCAWGSLSKLECRRLPCCTASCRLRRYYEQPTWEKRNTVSNEEKIVDWRPAETRKRYIHTVASLFAWNSRSALAT